MLLTVLVAVVFSAAVPILVFERSRRRHMRAAARWALSARIGLVLAEGLEEADTVGDVLRLLVPTHADWCVLYLFEDGQIRRAAVVHRDAAMEQRLKETLQRRPSVDDDSAVPSRVIRTGQAYLIREFGPAQLEKEPEIGRAHV